MNIRKERLMKMRIAAMALFVTTVSLQAEDRFKLPIADGPFKPSWESLQKFQCPEWFRDAKFGIWAHWGPQCQPEYGDWYARNMYIQGHADYKYHCEHYGHPSEFGFKDICHIWKAEKFDPEKLIALYKKAGAQYFVAMANHHDNFDNWNSKYQPWNAVNIGPHKDLVGLWEKAARAAGLHFGVTVHAARAWEWYEVSQLGDKTGPKAGVPYDGNLTKADGKGKWWEGLDPQDLYAQNHKSNSNPIDRRAKNRIPGDPPSTAYCQKFYNRVTDLIDSCKPDLLYFDDGGLPLGGVDKQIGLSIAADLYNTSIKAHDGHNEAIMTTKRMDDTMRKCWVLDIERGVSTSVDPEVWQTDTCIGSWHYNRPIYERHGYKTVTQVVHTLVDIVSKNGNLLLNIPVRSNGTIDEDEVKFLEGMAVWMSVNSECIYGTRPWKTLGEGPSAVEKAEAGRHGGARDTRQKPYTPQDFRFTTKDGFLYAVALAWPANGKLTVRTLATGAPGIKGDVASVELLGCKDKIAFKRDESGLVVTMPARKPCDHAYVLKIGGINLAASAPVVPHVANADRVVADEKGAIVLTADIADLHGDRIKCQGSNPPNIGYWDNPREWVSWKIAITVPGKYSVGARVASVRKENGFEIELAGRKLAGTAPKTESWNDFTTVSVGTIEIKTAGPYTVAVRPKDPQWKAINLATLSLAPVK